MSVFQQTCWGYELTYPDDWIHRTQADIEAFAAAPEALTPEYSGTNSGQILVHCEWNIARRELDPIWNRHMGMLASWLGAKKVGSAPWRISAAAGIEAEILLPAKDKRRLWAGILGHGFLVVKFVVLHLKEERPTFEPLATQIISSLRFPAAVSGLSTGVAGLPLPPGFAPMAVEDVVDGIDDPQTWRVYDGNAGVDALQAFYLREAPNFGWQPDEYAPYPAPHDLGFARLRLEKDGQRLTLAILPYAPADEMSAPRGRVVVRLEDHG